MAVLGRWTGGVQSQGNLPEAWAAPSGLFPTEVRNDSSAYTWASATSTITLPSSALADGYLFVGYYQYEDTSNGRLNPQGKIVQASGTGVFAGGPSGGYNRDTSEDRSYVRCWGFVDNPSASATFQFQWKADADDSTGGTVESCFEVIPLFYADVGVYTSTSSALYGGITPNQVTGFSGTDGSNITIASDTVTVSGDNKRYLALGSQFFEGRGGRTQRWHGLLVDGSKDDAAKAYSYYRNTSNDESGEIFTQLIETSTADRTIGQFCYRGDGIGAGQGGADADGSTPGVGDHALVVIELNDSAEVFKSTDGTGGVDLNVTGPVDISLCRTGDIELNDSASFTRASDSAMNAVQAMDGLFGANLSAAQEVVSVTSRWTAFGRFTVNGTEDDATRAGDYARNNQGSIDTFGWSANLLSYVSLSADDDIGASIQELTGGEDGGQYEIQPGWGGFWGINLDTLEGGGASFTLVMQGSGHTNSVDSLSLSQAATLTVAESAHSLGSDVVSLSQGFNLTVSDSDSAQVADSLVLTQSSALAVNESLHAVASSVPALTQGYSLLISDANHGFVSDSVNLVQSSVLLAADSLHGQGAESISLSQAVSLSVSDTDASVSSDGVALSQASSLSIAGALQDLSSDQVLLTESASLLVSESVHNHLAESLLLTQSSLLSVGQADSQQVVDGLELAQNGSLTAFSADHAQTSEAVLLTQAHTLGLDSALHAVNVDSALISQSGGLAVAGADSAQTVDVITVSQASILSVAESVHLVGADSALLSESASLAVNDSSHSVIADQVTLSSSGVLVAQGSTLSQNAESVSLTQSSSIITQSSLSGQSVEQVGLSQSIGLFISDCDHLSSVGETVLTQAVVVDSQDAVHSIESPSPVLSQAIALVTNEALHASIVDEVGFSSKFTPTHRTYYVG